MKTQFIRLFLLILMSLFLIGWLTEVFIDKAGESSPTVNVETIKSMIALKNNGAIKFENVKSIAVEKLEWPSDLKKKLTDGEIISLSNINQQVFYYWLLPEKSGKVIELGPFAQDKDNSSLYLSLSIIFYGVFALFLFAWLWPIFKDVIGLIKLTDLFSKKRTKIKSKVKPSSVMYPLAISVESMSRQIVRFLSLQRFLASSVSHDIRTPLSRISFLLAMTSAQNLDENKQKIDVELDEIDRLTDDFIELARIEECHHQLNIKQQHINPWLVELVQKIQGSSSVEVNLELSDDIIVRHDEKFLQRAIQNILVNAVKYADKQVLLTLDSGHDQIEIRIEDDGMGIKPEEQEKLTGLYERGKPSKKISSGYGIGLAFVNVIAEWHGGHVKISQSILLNGACVSLFLPKR